LVKRFYRVRVRLCKTAVISMIKNWRIWVIVANWIISPYWYVIFLILSSGFAGVQQGTVASPNIIDIIITIWIFFIFLPSIMVSLFIHNTVWMLLYYSISGAILCIVYWQYKKWKIRKLMIDKQ